ncbi:hypothetical protein SI859A1_03679 [Aurantimonas manganoxydans SI85-9A1]|uniref:Uncharacterized protein n=1 Tax=Aurantimonas manganoxydans (strain ATCC BAA-1229 / DSM 21871 / SI85-9A1) TaxID=287752 RepID=Q1YDG4_AURMS|nr:hypothetical protein SI859A1_03679 [Aurantimonas manganoxydans SI85-9A1]
MYDRLGYPDRWGQMSGIPCVGGRLNNFRRWPVRSAHRRGWRTALWPSPTHEAAFSTPSPIDSRPGREASSRRRRSGNEMDDTGLDSSFRENGDDRLGKAHQAIDDSKEDILDTAVLHLVHDPKPELGAFVLLEPDAQDLLGAVGAHAKGDVDRLFLTKPSSWIFTRRASKNTIG